MWKWFVAYICCVTAWTVCDAALQYSSCSIFQDPMRLPLLEACKLMDSFPQCLRDVGLFSTGTIIIAGYAAVGFLPLPLVPLVKRRWPLWITGAFVVAHLAMWEFFFTWLLIVSCY
jgi:hypothetical protein